MPLTLLLQSCCSITFRIPRHPLFLKVVADLGVVIVAPVDFVKIAVEVPLGGPPVAAAAAAAEQFGSAVAAVVFGSA